MMPVIALSRKPNVSIEAIQFFYQLAFLYTCGQKPSALSRRLKLLIGF
jgi:hypothetical protein